MELAKVTVGKDTAKRMMADGWLFDWSISSGAVSEKVAYLLDGSIQGLVEYERVPSSLFNFIYLIEAAPENVGRDKKILDVVGVLFAYVARDSLKAGFDGFVAFHSKTVLVDHYIKKYGAKIIRGDQLMFDTEASLLLINEYLGDDNGEQ